jgi:TetR/AcrR family transcriptional regulator, transcriptional repressor of aconitase
MPRLTREESRALTREKLFAAAQKVFTQDGFGGASIDRIVDEAGFSKGAFYSNFASKEDIFLQLVETVALHSANDLEAKLLGIHEPEAIIAAVCNWATGRAGEVDPRSLVLDLVRHARRDASLTRRHTELFSYNWTKVGTLLLKIFPEGQAPATALELGALVMELTFGLAMDFHAGPTAGDLIGIALRGLMKASRIE